MPQCSKHYFYYHFLTSKILHLLNEKRVSLTYTVCIHQVHRHQTLKVQLSIILNKIVKENKHEAFIQITKLAHQVRDRFFSSFKSPSVLLTLSGPHETMGDHSPNHKTSTSANFTFPMC